MLVLEHLQESVEIVIKGLLFADGEGSDVLGRRSCLLGFLGHAYLERLKLRMVWRYQAII